jgi:hypothetical protein
LTAFGENHCPAAFLHEVRLVDAEPAPESAGEVTADDLRQHAGRDKRSRHQRRTRVKNALFRALVDEIQVTGRHKIKPYFRVPLNDGTPGARHGVRIMTDWAHRSSTNDTEPTTPSRHDQQTRTVLRNGSTSYPHLMPGLYPGRDHLTRHMVCPCRIRNFSRLPG